MLSARWLLFFKALGCLDRGGMAAARAAGGWVWPGMSFCFGELCYLLCKTHSMKPLVFKRISQLPSFPSAF